MQAGCVCAEPFLKHLAELYLSFLHSSRIVSAALCRSQMLSPWISHENPDGHAGSPLRTNTITPTKQKGVMTFLNPPRKSIFFKLKQPGQNLHTEPPEQSGSERPASRSLYTEPDWLEAGEQLPWWDGRGCQSKGSRAEVGARKTTAWGEQKGETGRDNEFRCVRQSSQYPITCFLKHLFKNTSSTQK